jgi:hypothetical protein
MMPRCTSFLAALALLATAVAAPRAFAEPYTVETVGLELRADAESILELAAEQGIDAAVVRGFRRGRGWVFLVRIEGIEEREEAAVLAQRLAELSGRSVQVFLVAGKDVLPVEELSVKVGVAPDEGDPGETEVAGNDGASDASAAAEGAELLASMLLAHGGGRGDAPPPTALGWDPVHFRFERTADIGDGAMRVWHDLSIAGDKLRLEIKVLEGEGRNSITILHGDAAAWLSVDGELHELPPGPTREAMQAFTPAVVLEQAASIARWSAELPAKRVEPAGYEASLVWLELERDQADRLLVGLDAVDHRVRELVLSGDDGELHWTFADYREMPGGLVVPQRLQSSFAGQPREHVTVRALELPDAVDSSVFDPESLKLP